MAANPRAVMRALKAVAPAPSTGGFGNNPAPYIGPGPSPLVASYNESYGAHQYGTNSALPRDWMTFLSGMFGPLAPVQPVPIDIPQPGEERPEPRRWTYPVSYNMPGFQPGQPGLGRLASFETLRTLCDLYSVARNAINLRKNELRSVGWDIAPTRQAAKAMRGDHKAAADFAERRAKVVKFFRRPDPNYNDFTSWFFAILEEFFITDAVSLYLHPSRVKGKGLLGTNLAALDVLDGATIKPLVDIRGGRPAPSSVAYQQFEYGVPRVDLMTLLIEDADDPDPDGLLAEYRGDQLMYLPFMPRVWSPYGFAPIEGALVPVLTGINKQTYQSNYFVEGSVPGVYISPGDTSMTASQLRELQDALNAIAGDQAWKHKIIVLPGGSKVDPQRPVPLADDFDLLVQTQTVMGFDVQPFELGIQAQVSIAAASSGAARQAATAKMDLWQRKSTIPTLLFFKSVVFDRIIQDVCRQDDMEFIFEGLQDDQNIGELTPALVEQVGAGLASIDEARLELGREPWGLPITSDPGWATQWGGLVPLTGVTEATAQPLGGSPGPGGAGRGSRPASRAQDFSGPAGDPGLGAPAPATVPRNRQSTAQRREQARQVTTTQNSTGSRGTPAHSGATAHVAARQPRPQRAAKAAGGEPGAVREAIERALLAEDGVPVITDAPAASVRPALRELGLLRSHLRRGEQVSAWQPRYISPRVLSGVAENLARGMGVDLACDVAKAALTGGGGKVPKESVNYRLAELPGRRCGTCSMFRASSQGGSCTLVAGLIEADHVCDRWDARTAKALAGPEPAADGEPVSADVVRHQLAGNFPPAAIAWVADAQWTLADIPLHEVDTADEGSWAAHHQRERVRHFARLISEGHPAHPPVMVTVPGKAKARIVDGHHRFLGAQAAHRETIRAYVGRIPEGDRRWMETHSYQVHQGASSANKAAKGEEPVAAGLAVRAADTGRILMLQRAWDDDDPAGGFWEFPGGRLDNGEDALDAARREWAEETGCEMPDGSLDGIWNASNGRYRGFVLTVPSEDVVDTFGDRDAVDNPDHEDGDRVEALAWWDPGQLKGNPAVRPELLADVKRVKRALAKSEETPIVSTVHHPLGREGLWHTPDRHVRGRQQLPAYVQNTARAIAREHGGTPEEAIPMAIASVKAWAAGHAFGGKVKVTPEVQQAAQRALDEWERLKASHH